MPKEPCQQKTADEDFFDKASFVKLSDFTRRVKYKILVKIAIINRVMEMNDFFKKTTILIEI